MEEEDRDEIDEKEEVVKKRNFGLLIYTRRILMAMKHDFLICFIGTYKSGR